MSELYAVLLSCMIAPGGRFRLSKNPGTLCIVTTESCVVGQLPEDVIDTAVGREAIEPEPGLPGDAREEDLVAGRRGRTQRSDR